MILISEQDAILLAMVKAAVRDATRPQKKLSQFLLSMDEQSVRLIFVPEEMDMNFQKTGIGVPSKVPNG